MSQRTKVITLDCRIAERVKPVKKHKTSTKKAHTLAIMEKMA